ncbi:Cna B-type domain-containing protein [Lactococcus petauri]|uniref:lectin-like domain-containing protein n=1 Tax=Lactococcus petauri TaxID=1940789 RepID=UPI00207890C6|nr:Cna B-type domain-containing protein [Lactococcus petauri]USI67601.1 Cna B-type domain-containing protein [Lactococcus petauri]WJE12262.1 Cna B-type domain-containing protein [Lactococcus petauri]
MNKKLLGIGIIISLIISAIFTMLSTYALQTNAPFLENYNQSDVSTGATTLGRSDFSDNFKLSGNVGMRYQIGGAFNPVGPTLTEEEIKARYDEETGIVTLTPNRNDWSGNFTLNNRISTENPFKLKGAIYLGDRTDADFRDKDYYANGGTPSGGADGIGFAFHPEEVGKVGFTGANMGIGGLKGAVGYKFDTYWNTAQQSTEDDNHRLGWEGDPGDKGAHNGTVFGSFIETTTEPNDANTPLLNSGRSVPFATAAGFGVGDWSQVAWLDTNKVLQNSGLDRRIEIGDDVNGNPVQGPDRREVDNYGYDKNELLSTSKDSTTGFKNVIYDYQPNQSGMGTLNVYLLHGITANPVIENALTEEGINYDLIGQKEISSSDSLALAVSASTGAFRNLQQFRFDSFEYSAVKRLEVEKVWMDNNNANGLRPETIKIQIWANLKETETKEVVRLPYKTPIEISEIDNWHLVYDNLPKYNNEGREIFYDVTEIPVAGYESTAQSLNDENDSDIHFELTNKYQNPLSMSGNKIWLDEGNTKLRPNSIDIELWRKDGDQERQVKFKELYTGYQNFYGEVNPDDIVKIETNSSKNWTYTFSYLYGTENVAGVEKGIHYFFKEVLPDNYKYKYESQVIGRDIVNTPIIVEKTSLIIKKVWNDGGFESKRPKSIKVQLFADGIVKGEPLVISEVENWNKEISDLPLRDEVGNEISYSIKELGMSNNYKVNQTRKENTITLTNSIVKGKEEETEKEKEKDNNNNESGGNRVEPDITEESETDLESSDENLPIVGQKREVWIIVFGIIILSLVGVLINYRQKHKKD